MSQTVVTELRGAPTPLGACVRVSSLPHGVLLESSSGIGGAGRFSFVSADPFEVHRDSSAPRRHATDPFTRLARSVAAHRLPTLEGLPPFQGGAIGYMGYELGGWVERLPAARPDDIGVPDMWFGVYDWTLSWDHETGRSWLISTGLPERGAAGARRARRRGEAVLSLLSSGSDAAVSTAEPDEPRAADPAGWGVGRGRRWSGESRAGEWRHSGRGGRGGACATEPVAGLRGVRSTFSRDAYLAAVARVRRLILAGEIFQANLTQRLEARMTGNALSLYRRLRASNPSPFAAYLDIGGAAIVSGSPERFLLVRGDHVETRPIKGTAPRGATPGSDAELARTLLASEKDRAENVMIVDLVRNDLSRSCTDGSVRVERLCELEPHPTVHHLVSVVTGRLRPGLGALDALRAAFPGGSITGAPKPRAIEVLRDLEPTRRGVYTGAIGYVGFDGGMDTSIAIRTFVVRDGTAYFGVGGGVVLDSDPAAEYEETLAKARGLVAALEVGARDPGREPIGGDVEFAATRRPPADRDRVATAGPEPAPPPDRDRATGVPGPAPPPDRDRAAGVAEPAPPPDRDRATGVPGPAPPPDAASDGR